MAGSMRNFPSLNNNEYFFEVPEKLDPKKLIEMDTAIERFHQMADQRTQSQDKDEKEPYLFLPYHPLGTKRNPDPSRYGEKILRLKDGDIVFYDRVGDNDWAIAVSMIWREYKGRVWDYFEKISPELLPFNPARNHISPAELLFGFVEEDNNDPGESKGTRKSGFDGKGMLAFAGKVNVSFARLANASTGCDLLEDPLTLKILSSPKPPAPCLYFKSSGGYLSKQDLALGNGEPQGRKYYLHALRKDGEAVKLDQNGCQAAKDAYWPWESKSNRYGPGLKDKRAKQKVRIQPIRKGVSFYFHIDFENLSKDELGLLCFALRPDDKFEHKLGMGKPIGLGSIRIDPVGLFLINRLERYRSASTRPERYNGGVWIAPGENRDDWPELYDFMPASQCDPGNGLSPVVLAEDYAKSMKDELGNSIRLLGNPEKVAGPVHYPQRKNEDIEEKNFEWFVSNEKLGNKDGCYLVPLCRMDVTGKLPLLKRH